VITGKPASAPICAVMCRRPLRLSASCARPLSRSRHRRPFQRERQQSANVEHRLADPGFAIELL
jgi:hypothetical protein